MGDDGVAGGEVGHPAFGNPEGVSYSIYHKLIEVFEGYGLYS